MGTGLPTERLSASMLDEAPPIGVGEVACERLRYLRDEVETFTCVGGQDLEGLSARFELERRQFGEVAAPDALTAARMMGLASRLCPPLRHGSHGVLLLRNFNFAFRRPVFAGQELEIGWRVREVVPSRTTSGWIAQLDGWASVGRRNCVVGRGTVLVRRAPSPRKGPVNTGPW